MAFEGLKWDVDASASDLNLSVFTKKVQHAEGNLAKKRKHKSKVHTLIKTKSEPKNKKKHKTGQMFRSDIEGENVSDTSAPLKGKQETKKKKRKDKTKNSQSNRVQEASCHDNVREMDKAAKRGTGGANGELLLPSDNTLPVMSPSDTRQNAKLDKSLKRKILLDNNYVDSQETGKKKAKRTKSSLSNGEQQLTKAVYKEKGKVDQTPDVSEDRNTINSSRKKLKKKKVEKSSLKTDSAEEGHNLGGSIAPKTPSSKKCQQTPTTKEPVKSRSNPKSPFNRDVLASLLDKDTKEKTSMSGNKKEQRLARGKKAAKLKTEGKKTSEATGKKAKHFVQDMQSVPDSTPALSKSKESSMIQQETKTRKTPKTFLEKSKDRLNAARFRYLNEQMYTRSGGESFEMFTEDTEAFKLYHEGFESQVNKWPTNPILLIINKIKSRPKTSVVVDFGCGDAKLARSVPNEVHSFDLVAINEHVTVCDMSKVPLKDSSVDVAVFCLSLMGTNLCSYLKQANRVLKKGGILMIAEVKSRFKRVDRFTKKVEQLGFKQTDQEDDNTMFVMFEFKKKQTVSPDLDIDISLDPCLYKRR